MEEYFEHYDTAHLIGIFSTKELAEIALVEHLKNMTALKQRRAEFEDKYTNRPTRPKSPPVRGHAFSEKDLDEARILLECDTKFKKDLKAEYADVQNKRIMSNRYHDYCIHEMPLDKIVY